MGYLAELLVRLRLEKSICEATSSLPPWETQSAAEWLLALPSSFIDQREAMIDALRERVRWLTDFAGEEAIQAGLAAMARIPREQFIIPLIEELAYLPMSLDIGFEQTISHPELVLTIVASIGLGRTHVLDVGTGCGYLAAVLATMTEHVTSIEIIQPLAEQAQRRLHKFGIDNVSILVGDAAAPDLFSLNQFDAIVISAGSNEVPPSLLEALRDYGRIVMPLGVSQDEEILTVIEKLPNNVIRHIPLCPARFVPLTGLRQRPERRKRTTMSRNKLKLKNEAD